MRGALHDEAGFDNGSAGADSNDFNGRCGESRAEASLIERKTAHVWFLLW